VARDEPGTTGTSRYADHLGRDLRRLGAAPGYATTRPAGAVGRALAHGRRVGLDPGTFLAQYPLAMRWPEADVYHLTVQTYAGLLLTSPPPGPVVVTVHDIIPYLTRHDRRLRAYGHPVHRAFDWLAMRGLRRAQQRGLLVADSAWTKATLTTALGLDARGIAVVPLGVDSLRYRHGPVPASVRQRYRLADGAPYVLYVGSDDPRKGVAGLLRAFARVTRAVPGATLLKVGAVSHRDERRAHQRAAGALAIAHAVRFLDHVPEADLPWLYNASAVAVLPSSYEGFGLPVLEAMACGTPVVCAAAAALPEVAGDAAVLVPPGDAVALGEALVRVLTDPALRADLVQRGLARAAAYTWQGTAAATLGRYEAALHLSSKDAR
jgi:glycosyltransferase involved in cell wall biosynthesis